jgi:8-oxo-dGTP pyrophosphatase MutT (NUDIX family)
MKRSCGIIILYRGKIMLCHPTNAAWDETYGIPKGRIDPGETEIECAIREFFEETGIKVHASKLADKLSIKYENYKTKDVYKELSLFVMKIDALSEIGLLDEIVPVEQLQIAEIDWCGFLSKDEAVIKIAPRQRAVLDLLN